MTLKNKYLLFISLLHTICLVLSYFIFKEDKIWFVVAEAGILISLALSWQLYREMIQPLKLLVQGAEAIRDHDFNVKFVSRGINEMGELVGIYNQMMDELRMERTKQEEQHFFLDKLIMTSPVGIVVLDYDKKIQQVNPKAQSILFLADTDVNAPTQMYSALLSEINFLVPGKPKYLGSHAHQYKLQMSHFLDRGFQRYFIVIEELTEELARAEKQAYAKVIRMMSHEVNNTIGPVNSILHSALSIKNTSDSLAQAFQVAIDRNNNLNVFMRNLADVVKVPMPVFKTLDLPILLSSVLKLYGEICKEKNISIVYQPTSTPMVIQGDVLQMEQVLINIIKNAIESIGSLPNGKIEINTSPSPARLVVRDNGKGLPAEQPDYIFSPFFSTKQHGQGIGLTMTKEILMNHGYEFSLSTICAGKTEFTIRFG
ncbi:MAG TPA: ATP-binding protein [Cytophagaceae bacterium]|jgi:nitrogen fixation/metabolism regulation signal transduction histidine kinase